MMTSPFPGMDPYLELDWGDFHSRIAALATEQLNEQLPPELACRSEKRIVVCDPEGADRGIVPDVSVFETPDSSPFDTVAGAVAAVAEEVRLQLPAYEFPQHSLNIIDLGTGGRVITSIEFVSPVNKKPGEGLEKYRQKQDECRRGGVNLVEIDLCRSGSRKLIFPISAMDQSRQSTYAALVRRTTRPREVSYYRLPIREKLRGVPIPLRPADREVILELQPIVDRIYRTGRYGGFNLYKRSLQPPLDESDAQWSQAILASR